MEPPLSTSSIAEGKKRERNPAERRSLATMACETCRTRKSRCDEQKPRCGLCQKLDKDCVYQEPKPTKRDNTLSLILETLNSLNLKLDRALSPEPALPPAKQQPSKSTISILNPRASATTTGSSGRSTADNLFSSQGTSSTKLSSKAESSSSPALTRLESFQVPARQTTEVQKLLTWPAIQTFLECDGQDLSKWYGDNKGTENWLLTISMEFGVSLPLDWPVDIIYSEAGDLNLERGRSITLTGDYIDGLSKIFFRSFHCTYPILDPYVFYNEILPKACRSSFNESYEETSLVLLVLALGSVAQEGATGDSIVDDAGRMTGIRGGTVERPPGLVFLNEAKRRFGITLTNWTLNNLQTSILFAVYYSQVSRNLEYWRMAILSCTICQILVKSVVQWGTIESDRVARCFWMCSILQGGLTGELGLDLPGIAALQDSVPLPIFLTQETEHEDKTDEDLFIEYHFLAQITLRTLINRTRSSIQDSRPLFQECAEGIQSCRSIMQELSAQLENWRIHLPPSIAWDEDSREDISMFDPDRDIYKEAVTPVDPAITGMIDFKAILNAALRTRYKYAQYIIWRPYIYQVLHFPLDSAQHDYDGCWKALRAFSMWPLTFATFQSQRRLIPHLYEYTHTFFGVLILMHVCTSHPVLGPLLESMPAAYEIRLSTDLYLAWIRDMRTVHPVARWCWQLLKVIYKDHKLVQESLY